MEVERPAPRAGMSQVTRALVSADGVRIDAVHVPPHPDASAPGTALVVAHGFTGSWRRPTVRRVIDAFQAHAGVVSFDFRGHGASGGLSTVGDREVLDVDAAVRWARVLGYERVATVGWSMGAACVVRHAGLLRSVDAVAAVSGPARWYYRGTRPMRRVHWAFERRSGRALLRHVYRTRIDPLRWDESAPDSWPEPPYAVAARIPPIPFLVVHGDRDEYFPLDHAEQLAQAAGAGAELWVVEGFGHAEAAASPALLDRIARWVVAA